MQDKELNYDAGYRWTETKSCAHDYLFPVIESIFDEFKISKDALILDACCGAGYILDKLYNRGYKNVWGFDLSESGIKLVQENYGNLKDRYAMHNFYESCLPPPFPKNNYDVILSIETIEHLYKPRVCLINGRSWLKNEGLMVITVPYHGYLKNLAIALLNKFDFHFNPLKDGGHIKFFSKKTLYRLLKDLKIEPIRFCGAGRVPFFWKSMVVVCKKSND